MGMSLILRFKQPATIQLSDGIDEYDIEHFRIAPNPKAGKWANSTIEVTDKDTEVVLPVALRDITHLETISGVFCTRTNNGSQVSLPAEYQNRKDALRYFRDQQQKDRKENGESKTGRPQGSIRILEALEQYTTAKTKQAEDKGKFKTVKGVRVARSMSGTETAVFVKAFIAHTGVVMVKDVTAESIDSFSRSLKGHINTNRKKLKKLRAFMMAALSGDIARYVRNNYDVVSNRDAFFQAANQKVSALFGKVIKLEQTPEVKYYHRNEISKMRAAFTMGSFEQVAFELYLQTGLRASEGTHLLWENCSFERNAITIEAIDGTWTSKTGKYRTVDVSDSLMRILKEWKKVSPSKKFVLGLGDEGDPQDYNVIRDMLNRAAKKAGLNFSIDLKTFRSTHACECLWAGFDIYTVSARLGHSKQGQNNAGALGTTIKYLLPNPYIQRTALNAIWGD